MPADTPAPADQLPPGATPGGCRWCDAYTTPVDVDGVQLVRVRHEDDCATEDYR